MAYRHLLFRTEARDKLLRGANAVGDGTSTATILAYSIYSEGLRNIAAGGAYLVHRIGDQISQNRIIVRRNRRDLRPLTPT